MILNRSIYLIFILIVIPTSAFCRFRPIDIKKELKAASFVGEILFIGYDSVHVSRYNDHFYAVKTDSLTGEEVRVNTTDSIWIISKFYYQKIGTANDSIYSAEIDHSYGWAQYYSRPDTLPRRGVSNGYWPKLNEECLLVVDSIFRVSVFAQIDNDKYIFWDPYWNSSWNTVFAFNDTFEFYPLNGRNSSNNKVFKHVADFMHMKYASQYHCAIRKELLWNEIINGGE